MTRKDFFKDKERPIIELKCVMRVIIQGKEREKKETEVPFKLSI